MIAGVQITMVFLIMNIELNDPKFKVIPADSYLIIIPRLLSSIMMHLNVEPDIRGGLSIMKYACNHPRAFKMSQADKDRGKDVSQRRVFFGFFLGLCQAGVGFLVEFCVVVYLTSLTSLIDIIMKYISMASIARFDDMYASAIYESRVKKAVGKKLKFENKRHMWKNQFNTNPTIQEDDWESSPDQIPHPREGKFWVQGMRVVYKLFRTYYVSFTYYFMPFFALIITFAKNKK